MKLLIWKPELRGHDSKTTSYLVVNNLLSIPPTNAECYKLLKFKKIWPGGSRPDTKKNS